MSLHPRPWPEVPPLTAQVARAAFRKGNLAMHIRDELAAVYEDERFTAAFGVRGRPGISPGQLMMVTVLQFSENLTDRQAADAVRDRVSWKYALGLELDDAGFDASVLSEFRTRLVEGDLSTLALDALLARLAARGLVKAGGRARTDSTHVLGAIRHLCRLELAGETLRAALEALASAAPDWLTGVIDPSWQLRYGARIDNWHLPESETRRTALMLDHGRDGYHLLEQVAAPTAPPWLRELPAVDALRRVWCQQFYRTTTSRGAEVVRRRESESEGGDGLPPGRDRLISPYDLDARHSIKRDHGWDGYKVHVSETCNPPDPAPTPTTPQAADSAGRGDLPNLITGVLTTAATTSDAAALEEIHTGLARNRLLPAEHLLDSGYPSAEQIVRSARTHGVTLVTPVLLDQSAQARAAQGYDKASFSFDFDQQHGTCPQGVASTSWTPCRQRDTDAIVVTWAKADCGPCPKRELCTKGTRRQITIRDRDLHEALAAARAEQTTDEWKRRYAARAGIEGTMRQATHVTGTRTARYVGLPKTTLEHNIAATAINMIRLDAYWTGQPLDRTRATHLARLDFTQAAA
ncbi:IS1182 family transposase [Frankia sp. CiP1_Cm_nod2]|uniref:IS1182 family transposase n=1 Tax=Frankia sp. CiP1_Cm_nod2 TaxID=2897161 RepID=UPI0020240F70